MRRISVGSLADFTAASILLDQNGIGYDVDGFGRFLVNVEDVCSAVEIFDKHNINHEII